MQKIGLFFGSFNPIHIGHLIIANYMANYTDLSEVWLVVSPHNPLKRKDSLLNMYDRLEMVNLAIDNTDRIRASDIEFRLTQPSYTIDTLVHLKERYPTKDFVLIMGSDNLVTLKKWKNYEIILRDFFVYVYPRPGYDAGEWAEHPRITFTETPLMEISSTFIRNAIKDHKSVKYFLPDKVLDFIDKKGVYL
ncbi:MULTISPECIES: nicotinate (nicotinamide) nucleotide adenylyltransferase [Olivibacter]|jgi:nicotinate-nucleotide adenylyltransferase|uniref:Probable nicotinate-nucleotide adenylyltransferase n=1 Tax=Olivibacter oleidegradans TaxID=760123 RepID=A0ABV6HFD5_9SPHI|nr:MULTISPECIES: nicotinate (nicotinamide) nucleotide adenylyltransferase [Olivibacter]MCL4638786.1 nicotinate (nicotinamide) nucleotide adenylyltransferase [Olivibacter sp. UJ_SKK_5.1]MDM8177649.1 nicotinate (nicotinamide) nucleotide adenylyltransferase [Olivibacter sp. 47]MDX3912369.1 nicotinate (nicotinamide) nucleotide adenylyltransferase [Pseudosphingobacterium sp.]QEL00091.1 nicotinate-nucleotide adenylyltransferase [Olivibacter sp. LS-1]